MEIVDEIAETLDDLISTKFCSSCLHRNHGEGKCYALNYNGVSYSSCTCEHTKLDVFIRVKVGGSNFLKTIPIKTKSKNIQFYNQVTCCTCFCERHNHNLSEGECHNPYCKNSPCLKFQPKEIILRINVPIDQFKQEIEYEGTIF